MSSAISSFRVENSSLCSDLYFSTFLHLLANLPATVLALSLSPLLGSTVNAAAFLLAVAHYPDQLVLTPERGAARISKT